MGATDQPQPPPSVKLFFDSAPYTSSCKRPNSPSPQGRRIREACGHMRRPWKGDVPSTFPARGRASQPRTAKVETVREPSRDGSERFESFPFREPGRGFLIRKDVRATLQPQNVAIGPTWTPRYRFSTESGLPNDSRSPSGAYRHAAPGVGGFRRPAATCADPGKKIATQRLLRPKLKTRTKSKSPNSKPRLKDSNPKAKSQTKNSNRFFRFLSVP